VARFVDLPGQQKVEGREYAFQEAHTSRQISLSDQWGGSFIPGRKVDMSMVYKDLTGPKSACPGCGIENNGSIDEEIKWYELICHTEFLCLIIAFTHSSSCSIYFRRIALLEENEDNSDDEGECTHMETNINLRKRMRASRTNSSKRQKVSVDASRHSNEIRMFRRVHILLRNLTSPKPISDPPGISSKDISPPHRPEVDNHFFTIKCICGFDEADGQTILCEDCETWQHVKCYYHNTEVPGAEDEHYCVNCDPRQPPWPVDAERAAIRQRRARKFEEDGRDRKAARDWEQREQAKAADWVLHGDQKKVRDQTSREEYDSKHDRGVHDEKTNSLLPTPVGNMSFGDDLDSLLGDTTAQYPIIC
jgi:hypothetical protein